MVESDIVFKRNAKPGKKLKFSNHCLACGDPIPANRDFCDNDICEYNFYDDSHLERDLNEALAEQQDLEREERKAKAGLFEVKNE